MTGDTLQPKANICIGTTYLRASNGGGGGDGEWGHATLDEIVASVIEYTCKRQNGTTWFKDYAGLAIERDSNQPAAKEIRSIIHIDRHTGIHRPPTFTSKDTAHSRAPAEAELGPFRARIAHIIRECVEQVIYIVKRL